MKNYYKNQIELPTDLKDTYQLSDILSIRRTSIIGTLKKKIPHSEVSHILKIIPKNQYNKILYDKLSKRNHLHIVYPEEEYHTRHFVYFIFPKLQSLSFLVQTGKMDFQKIKTLFEDIGSTLLLLHKEQIFHMDVSPGNIYMNHDGHFLLGDFSSAICTTHEKSLFPSFFKKAGRTGSTPGFFPEVSCSPASYDIYGFCMILFLLLNQGKPVGIQTGNTKTSPEIEQLKKILIKNINLCKTDTLEESCLEETIKQMQPLFLEVKEQKILTKIIIEASEYEKSLFCSFTEPGNYKIQSILHKCFSFIKNIKSIPKSLYMKEKQSISSPYKLFICCGIIFLIVMYHLFLEQNNTSQTKTWQDVKNQQTIKTSFESTPALGSQTKEVPGSYIIPTAASPTETPIPEQSKKLSKHKQTIIDISNKSLSDTSFLSKVESPNDIMIIFAERNQYKNCYSFFIFSNLKELYLNQNDIISTDGISALQSLEILDLSENKLKDISELSMLKNLKILDLSGQSHINGLRRLKELKTLQYLILTNTNVKKSDILFLQKSLPACTILY